MSNNGIRWAEDAQVHIFRNEVVQPFSNPSLDLGFGMNILNRIQDVNIDR